MPVGCSGTEKVRYRGSEAGGRGTTSLQVQGFEDRFPKVAIFFYRTKYFQPDLNKGVTITLSLFQCREISITISHMLTGHLSYFSVTSLLCPVFSGLAY